MSADNKAVVIEPNRADIRIEVAEDGVFIGFFAANGTMTLVSMDALARGEHLAARAGLAAWVADRREQAKAVDTAR